LIGEYESALEIYKEAMKLKPSFPEAYYNYARVLDKMGDLEKALYMVRHALTLRYWNTSTIKKSDVEAFLAVLEEKEREEQLKAPKKKAEAEEIQSDESNMIDDEIDNSNPKSMED
ncbi:MAG: tetratricopeptide repeat protein, partial [Clostridia bacterium]|nr:tetratricopeptide repeat protein [Clostridia bacterium]